MKVLLIGSGGREHALAWAIANSPSLTKLYAAPGNAGIANEAECLDLDPQDHRGIVTFCQGEDIDLVVIGPEAPLADGLSDALIRAEIAVFGPSQAAAQLEASKDFTKSLCAEKAIPTAAYATYRDAAHAKTEVLRGPFPVVLKADGLAAGKGVVIAHTEEDAEATIDAIFDGAYDGSGAKLIVEDFLEGEEVSVFALCDGKTALFFGSAQDHKRAFDGDEGPNTGGMGAYSPAPVLTDTIKEAVMRSIIAPTLETMACRGTPFKGVLFAGVMITDEGPKLIEYNVRFGDPECQALMMRLKDDILLLMKGTVDGVLDRMTVRFRADAALSVVVASNGYPDSYAKGVPLPDVDAHNTNHLVVFHAGTAREGDQLVATGGRVLGVTALGETVAEAQHKAYAAVDAIRWEGGFCRRDIGWRAVAREVAGGS